MTDIVPRSPINQTAAALRERSLAVAEGILLGSEDALVTQLKVSKITLRQAARLLEREGLLLVKRGINGGYFTARPKVEMVEAVVCSYLDTLGLDPHYSGTVTTALWVQVLREAARADRAAARSLAEEYGEALHRLAPDASMFAISQFERESRAALFALIDGAYLEVLFRINSAFARHRLDPDASLPEGPAHMIFVRDWKRAKLAELDAIADGDEMLAVMAATHSRNLWIARGLQHSGRRLLHSPAA